MTLRLASDTIQRPPVLDAVRCISGEHVWSGPYHTPAHQRTGVFRVCMCCPAEQRRNLESPADLDTSIYAKWADASHLHGYIPIRRTDAYLSAVGAVVVCQPYDERWHLRSPIYGPEPDLGNADEWLRLFPHAANDPDAASLLHDMVEMHSNLADHADIAVW